MGRLLSIFNVVLIEAATGKVVDILEHVLPK